MSFLEKRVRDVSRPGLETVGRVLAGLKLTPDLVTNIGLVLTVAVAVLSGLGRIRWAGVVYILAAVCDALDGTLARVTGKGSRFGAFLDSTVDRFEESIVLLGLLVYYARLGGRWEGPVILVATVASLMVSYTRARAEALGVSCKVGLMTRPARVFVTIAGMILNQVPITLAIVAATSLFTALHRVYHVWKLTGGEDGGWQPAREPFVPFTAPVPASDENEA